MSGRPDSRTDTSARLLAAARRLAADALAAEAVEALRDVGVRSILLRELDGCHLLVEPDEMPNAAAALSRLGFEPRAERWVRGATPADVVVLHDDLPGAHAPEEIVWARLSARTDRMVVAGSLVEVLDAPRHALAVTLHAAAGATRSIADLERTLAVADDHVWGQAERLAARIGARESFAAGLRLVPAGRTLAAQLGLQPPMSPEVAMHASTLPDSAALLERLHMPARKQSAARALVAALRRALGTRN